MKSDAEELTSRAPGRLWIPRWLGALRHALFQPLVLAVLPWPLSGAAKRHGWVHGARRLQSSRLALRCNWTWIRTDPGEGTHAVIAVIAANICVLRVGRQRAVETHFLSNRLTPICIHGLARRIGGTDHASNLGKGCRRRLGEGATTESRRAAGFQRGADVRSLCSAGCRGVSR
jgi:hypothetical protein